MRSPGVLVLLLAGVCFSLATQLAALREQSQRQHSSGGGLVESVMGDTRRLFANHFITKADVYLHSGVYPSIFDRAAREKKTHLASATESPHTAGHDDHSNEASDHHEHSETCEHHDEHDIVAAMDHRAPDWIAAFGQNFYPTKHVHLGEKGDQRELLPWLRLAAELNPHEVQTYTLASYWLRNRLGKIKEAEEFLRQGWRANPHSYEILCELGRLYEENRSDLTRARNLLEAALREWKTSESGKERPDEFALMQITVHLAGIEEREGRYAQAIHYLELLRPLSPHPESIQKRIDGLQLKAAAPSAAVSTH